MMIDIPFEVGLLDHTAIVLHDILEEVADNIHHLLVQVDGDNEDDKVIDLAPARKL